MVLCLSYWLALILFSVGAHDYCLYLCFSVVTLHFMCTLYCISTSFHQKVSFWPIKLVQPSTFHWNTCTNPGKWAVMYLCVKVYNLPFRKLFLFTCLMFSCSKWVHMYFFTQKTPHSSLMFLFVFTPSSNYSINCTITRYTWYRFCLFLRCW
jgi:hypothetical protein